MTTTRDVFDSLTHHGPRPGSKWRHFKNGKSYEVVALALRERDLAPCVVYKDESGVHWIRTVTEWASRVRWENKLVARFTPLT